MGIIKSVFYFILAGIFEIGGGYLIWIWLREGKGILYGIVGVVSLIVYGVIPTLQPPSANFGRVYANVWWHIYYTINIMGLEDR